MNPEPTHRPRCNAGTAGLGFAAACLIVALAVLALKHSERPAAVDADRAAQRAKALAEIRAAETQALNQPGWVDQNRGIVRLPVSVAMEITVREWQNPAQARADLMAREEKAAAPAPAAPAKPNPYE